MYSSEQKVDKNGGNIKMTPLFTRKMAREDTCCRLRMHRKSIFLDFHLLGIQYGLVNSYFNHIPKYVQTIFIQCT